MPARKAGYEPQRKPISPPLAVTLSRAIGQARAERGTHARQLALFFPDGRTEYWLTVMTFETRTRDGDSRHATVTLAAADSGSA